MALAICTLAASAGRAEGPPDIFEPPPADTASAAVAGSNNHLVDRLSERFDAAVLGEPDGKRFRAAEAATDADTRSVVTGASLVEAPAGGLVTVSLSISRPGDGARLLLADAGVVLRGGGAAFVPVPNQRAVLDVPQNTVKFEALPLDPDQPVPPAGTALTAVLTNEAGVLAVLRTVQGLEALDGPRLRRYLRPEGAGFVVDTRVKNRDVDLANWMVWSADPTGAAQARFPRDDIRFALHAVTAGYTIQQVADWLRLARGLALEPAMAAAWEHAHRTEFLLERAGLNHRVFSPNHADFHFNRGVDAYLLGDLPTAEKAFEKAEETLAGDIQARFAKGVVQYRAGRFDEAGATFLVATGLPGAGADVFYNRGAVAFRQGDKLNAARNFRRALELEPQHPEATVWLHKADPEGRTAPPPEPPKSKKRSRRGRKRR